MMKPYTGVTSNKPRPSVQHTNKNGNRHWLRDVHHATVQDGLTLCGVKTDGWIVLGELSTDTDLCLKCKARIV